MFTYICDIITNHCVSEVISGFGPIMHNIVTNCHAQNIDLTHNYTYISALCVQQLFASEIVQADLEEHLMNIQLQIKNALLSAARWSKSDQIEIDTRLYFLRTVLQKHVLSIVTDAMTKQNVACEEAVTNWLVPFPIAFTHTTDIEFVTHCLVLNQMTSIKDNRAERSILCICFIVVILLSWIIVGSLLLHYHQVFVHKSKRIKRV